MNHQGQDALVNMLSSNNATDYTDAGVFSFRAEKMARDCEVLAARLRGLVIKKVTRDAERELNDTQASIAVINWRLDTIAKEIK